MGTIKNITLDKKTPNIVVDGVKVRQEFIYYLYWMKERMDIFWKKLHNEEQPWTEDPILKLHKFTNVYRCLDRTSQYLLKNVIYNGKKYSDEEMIWRILLFKHFNRGETWDLLLKQFGDITNDIKIDDIDKYLIKCLNEKETLYSNAYMMTSQMSDRPEIQALKLTRKHSIYFHYFKTELFGKNLIGEMTESKSFEELFNVIMKMTATGNFTSYQYATDLNYSNVFNFDDNSFTVPGPGSLRGMDKLFTNPKEIGYTETIVYIKDHIDELRKIFSEKYQIDLSFAGIKNWKPTLIDYQNCLCETDKYTRGLHLYSSDDGKRIKQIYKERKNSPINLVFPDKWNVKLDIQNIIIDETLTLWD